MENGHELLTESEQEYRQYQQLLDYLVAAERLTRQIIPPLERVRTFESPLAGMINYVQEQNESIRKKVESSPPKLLEKPADAN